MKTLECKLQVLYRFRCDKCRSLFEMTENEKSKTIGNLRNMNSLKKRINGYVIQ